MSNDQRCPTGKICYSARHYAKRAARRLVARARAVKAQLYAYPCRLCGYWHIGHATKQERSYYREAVERAQAAG